MLLPRDLTLGSVGDDVYGVKRAVARLLDRGDHGHRLMALEDKRLKVRQTFGPFFAIQVGQARKYLGLPAGAGVDAAMWKKLEANDAPDARARHLIDCYAKAHPQLVLCYPHPRGYPSTVCQGIHPTAGILGSWAIDFCAPGGTPVLCVEAGTVVKLSGHDPRQGDLGGAGIFGWSVYVRTRAGYVYFSTHYGDRQVTTGKELAVGDVIGHVGHWPGNEGRSHTHYGLQSPLGERDAKKRITAVSQAYKVLPWQGT